MNERVSVFHNDQKKKKANVIKNEEDGLYEVNEVKKKCLNEVKK